MKSRRNFRPQRLVTILPFALAALVLVLLAALAPSQANATTFTLTDDNSSSQINPSTQAGMFNWYVDGVNYLNQQWFWYRVGSGPQHSIDTLTLTGATLVDPSTLKLKYTGTGFTVAVTFFLQGGQPGSGTADMGEAITINNTSTSSLDFHLFEYVDFNLSPGQDKAKLIYANTIDQYYQSNTVSETSVSPNPSRWEIANYPSTLNHLNGTPNYTLNDTPALGVEAGPGNLTWAFEYDKVIPRGQSLIISKDKVITVIPIPASAILLGTGLLGLVGAGLKRRR
jgi:hypothetical protein